MFNYLTLSLKTLDGYVFLHISNTSTFICMGVDLTWRPAITSSFRFAAPHINAGISHRGLWRVWPSLCSFFSHSLFPRSASLQPPPPFGSAFDVSTRNCAEHRGLPGLPASTDTICSGSAFMWFTPAARLPASYSASHTGPSLFRVQESEQAAAAVAAAAWPGPPDRERGRKV